MIREPAVAGAFYTGDPVQLKQEIISYLSNVNKKVEGDIKGIISPHAGYIYSGQVAAYGYRQIAGKSYDYVVVFAPCHRGYFDGVSVFNGDGYKTPLGIVPVYTEIINQLLSSSNLINFYPQAHLQEHSLEVQVPFLQVVLKDFKLIPVLVGTHDINQLNAIAEIFKNVFTNKNVLFVASTDLSHFYPAEIGNKLDAIAIEYIEALDYKGFFNAILSKKTEACGAAPVYILMYLASLFNWDKCKILKYADSGDVSGDKSNIVGYVSAVIYKDNNDDSLSDNEKEILHKIARESIRSKLFNDDFNFSYERTEKLKQQRGAFVTLHKNGELRGCIGYIVPYDSLDSTVKKMAVAAAFEDPRFPPLRKDEFEDIDIEISALTPLRKIDNINEIEVGKHGILIRKGPYSGVLLPQVATEYNWDRITFLNQTCMKAGLHSNCWQDEDTEIYIFSAEVF